METFTKYIEQLRENGAALAWQHVLEEAGGPDGIAILVIDLVRGFCDIGPLASPRVNRLLGPVADFLTRAHQSGVSKFYFGCDSHTPDSPEFRAFPPHCIRGTPEADVAPSLMSLPFADKFRIFPKESLNALLDTGLEDVLLQDEALKTLILVGDCTDLCIYSTAMHARLLANCRKLPWTVMVPSNLVDTYHLGVDVAAGVGAMAHDGDALHAISLYQMQLNGIRVVGQIL